jgi:hypothetical protein
MEQTFLFNFLMPRNKSITFLGRYLSEFNFVTDGRDTRGIDDFAHQRESCHRMTT